MLSYIFGDRITLRDYQNEDLEHIRGWVNDPDITHTLSDQFLYPHSRNETESFLEQWLKVSRVIEVLL